MGFGSKFLKNMNKRCFQYAVRSTYPLFEKDKPGRDSYSYSTSKREKESEIAVDKNGVPVREYTYCTFKGKKCFIKEVKGKMVTFDDGTRHRASSIEME